MQRPDYFSGRSFYSIVLYSVKPKCNEMPPGCVGALIDEVPLLTTAQVRPYVIATLLHRGAAKDSEIISSLVSHCPSSDLKVGGWDPFDEEYCEGTRLEKMVNEVLGEFVSEGLVRYNEEQGLWVLTTGNIPKVISWVAALGAKMPQHLLMEMSREQLNRLPSYLEI
jgi:hypothetical protein